MYDHIFSAEGITGLMTQESWEAMNGLAPRCRLFFSKICSKVIGASAERRERKIEIRIQIKLTNPWARLFLLVYILLSGVQPLVMGPAPIVWERFQSPSISRSLMGTWESHYLYGINRAILGYFNNFNLFNRTKRCYC